MCWMQNTSKNKPETAERAMTFTPEGGRLKRPNIWRVRGHYNGWNCADSKESAVQCSSTEVTKPLPELIICKMLSIAIKRKPAKYKVEVFV